MFKILSLYLTQQNNNSSRLTLCAGSDAGLHVCQPGQGDEVNPTGMDHKIPLWVHWVWGNKISCRVEKNLSKQIGSFCIQGI